MLRFELCNCGSPVIHGNFIDEDTGDYAFFPVSSRPKARALIDSFVENGIISSDQTGPLQEAVNRLLPEKEDPEQMAQYLKSEKLAAQLRIFRMLRLDTHL